MTNAAMGFVCLKSTNVTLDSVITPQNAEKIKIVESKKEKNAATDNAKMETAFLISEKRYVLLNEGLALGIQLEPLASTENLLFLLSLYSSLVS